MRISEREQPEVSIFTAHEWRLCRVRHNRHSCAVRMLLDGKPVSEIKIRLGHENIQSTMTYLHMDLTRKRDIQNKFMEYSAKTIQQDPKIEELIDWENKQDILAWLDSL